MSSFINNLLTYRMLLTQRYWKSSRSSPDEVEAKLLPYQRCSLWRIRSIIFWVLFCVSSNSRSRNGWFLGNHWTERVNPTHASVQIQGHIEANNHTQRQSLHLIIDLESPLGLRWIFGIRESWSVQIKPMQVHGEQTPHRKAPTKHCEPSPCKATVQTTVLPGLNL